MIYAVIGLIVSFVLTLWIVRWLSARIEGAKDHDLSGVQKFHVRPVPRVGGIAILGGCIAGTAWISTKEQSFQTLAWLLIVCSIPAFASGLIEDLTKRVRPLARLLFTMLAAALAAFAMDAVITRTGISQLDWVMQFKWLAIGATVVAVAGMANAVNIIDGFNGLAAMVVVIMLVALGYIAFIVGDQFIWTVCLMLIGAVLGFFVWNWPGGLIFLGDGGAYFLGFMVAELGVLLVARNPQVSPWTAILIFIYPVFETLFSIYRKRFVRGMSPGVPDGVHFHMLVFKRMVRWAVGRRSARLLTLRNSMTAPYLWALSGLSVVPAVLFWRNQAITILFVLVFCVSYVWLYRRIVRFDVPRWMVWRKSSFKGGRDTRAEPH